MPAKYLRGALVQFSPGFLVPVPNPIVFQFNPESLTRSVTGAQAGTEKTTTATAAGEYPTETLTFTMAMDAGDQIADGTPAAAGMALESGIQSRLAALELLRYPILPEGLLRKRSVPRLEVPLVLFVWGRDRILPVRVTNLQITETLYDAQLHPTHAEATVGLEVFTPDRLATLTEPLRSLGRGAWAYSHGLRLRLASQNLAASSGDLSVIGLLP